MNTAQMVKIASNLKHNHIVITNGVEDAIAESDEFAKFVLESCTAFKNGNWGKVSADSWEMNDLAKLMQGMRILAIYENVDGQIIWINKDEIALTILLPSEY